MKGKLGLSDECVDSERSNEDEELVQNLLMTMQNTSCDFTNTFCILMDTDWTQEDSRYIKAVIFAEINTAKLRNFINFTAIYFVRMGEKCE